jgi:hypothetical protein
MSSAKKQVSNRQSRARGIVNLRSTKQRAKSSEEHVTHLLQTAITHHQTGNFVEAVRLYQNVFEIDSQNAVCLHLWA